MPYSPTIPVGPSLLLFMAMATTHRSTSGEIVSTNNAACAHGANQHLARNANKHFKKFCAKKSEIEKLFLYNT